MDRMVKVGRGGLAGLFALALSCTTAAAAQLYFGTPAVLDGAYRVDICLEWGMKCNGEAANVWCQSQGYDRAVEWKDDPDIGAAHPTMVLGTGQTCAESYCDGYASVVCAREDAWTESTGHGGLLVEVELTSKQSPQGVLVIAVSEADPAQATAAVVDLNGLALLHAAPGSWRLYAVDYQNAQPIHPSPGWTVAVPPGTDGGFVTFSTD